MVSGATPEDIAGPHRRNANYIGTMHAEVLASCGQPPVNEMAPRPHNSGHYTIDACAIESKFEQQAAACAGCRWAEGARAPRRRPRSTCSATFWYDVASIIAEFLLNAGRCCRAVPGPAHLSRHHVRPGRKMGHFTVIGDDPEGCGEAALAARAAVGVRDA